MQAHTQARVVHAAERVPLLLGFHGPAKPGQGIVEPPYLAKSAANCFPILDRDVGPCLLPGFRPERINRQHRSHLGIGGMGGEFFRYLDQAVSLHKPDPLENDGVLRCNSGSPQEIGEKLMHSELSAPLQTRRLRRGSGRKIRERPFPTAFSDRGFSRLSVFRGWAWGGG